VYFDAGEAARGAGDQSSALVLLNRFIDICDAIDDGARDGSRLDNSDFIGTGFLAPGDFILPRRSAVGAKDRERAKDWVLAASMDRSVTAKLNTRTCAGCAAICPEVALACPACALALPACVVTGFPILRGTERACKSCNSKAINVYFDDFVKRTKVCVWCQGAP
jgi:intraflagellar transport protein 172